MAGGGGRDEPLTPSPLPPSSTNDGEILLRLLQSHRQQQQHPHSSPTHNLSIDPAVAAVGPSVPVSLPLNHHRNFFLHPQQQGFSQNTPPPPSPWPHHHSPSPPSHHQTSSFFSTPHQHFDRFRHHQQQQPLSSSKVMFGNIPFHDSNNYTSHTHDIINNNSSISNKNQNFGVDFDLFKERELGFNLEPRMKNGFDPNFGIEPRVNWTHNHGSSHEPRRPGPPPGFLGKPTNQRRSFVDLNNVGREVSTSASSSTSEFSSNYRGFGLNNDKNYEKERQFPSRDNGVRLSEQVDHSGLPAGSALHSVSGSDIEQSLKVLHGGGEVENGVSQEEVDELSEQLVDSVLAEDVSDEKNETSAKKKHHRDKDFRSDARGKWILPQRMRNSKRLIECRRDIYRLSSPFVAIYESLIPSEEDKAKQRQLMALLERLVCREWPKAKLYLYGSCANSFGVSKSDIDVCLAIDDQDINKSEMLLKLADILQSDNLENVQALTRARVPIVKLMDPVTGISCDICINNLLAVVNTKLLRDYADIDVRLRQLAYLVKHWAKSRGVNETYQGTLSSYAYVLMCIHFLQQRNPPILPCLQGMKATYAVSIDNINCSFFDQVERLRDFGARNNENVAQLLWAFFSYWAYCHDYANSVISVRTGCILSKHEKDWTRRVGNDRHLICIEDPFETSHDLGRVVDKHSIRVLREEFERAAYIMQNDPNPCVALFEPYIPS